MSRLELSPFARNAIGDFDRTEIERRVRDMGVRVRAGMDTRRGSWVVSVVSGPLVTTLVGKGPLAAVIAGALDDWEEVA